MKCNDCETTRRALSEYRGRHATRALWLDMLEWHSVKCVTLVLFVDCCALCAYFSGQRRVQMTGDAGRATSADDDVHHVCVCAPHFRVALHGQFSYMMRTRQLYSGCTSMSATRFSRMVKPFMIGGQKDGQVAIMP